MTFRHFCYLKTGNKSLEGAVVSKAEAFVFANTARPQAEWKWRRLGFILTNRLSALWYSRSRLLNDSGRESARLDSVGPPFTLSRRERTLFCRFLAKRARRIFHIAASLRLATLVRTAVMAAKREITNLIYQIGGEGVSVTHMGHSWGVLVGKGNSLLQSRCNWASRDSVSKRLTKNSQLRAGMSFFRKCSSRSLLRMIGRSLTTVSNWKSRHRHNPWITYTTHI